MIRLSRDVLARWSAGSRVHRRALSSPAQDQRRESRPVPPPAASTDHEHHQAMVERERLTQAPDVEAPHVEVPEG